MKDRVLGKYRNDSESFEAALKDLLGKLDYDQSKPIQKESAYDSLVNRATHSAFEEVLDEIYGDREILREEIAEQLRRKLNKKRNLTKRQMSDFVRSRPGEASAFRAQLISAENRIEGLTAEQESMEQDKEQQFDQEAYSKLKQELSERKEAKERLLSQGIPQFKAYLRF